MRGYRPILVRVLYLTPICAVLAVLVALQWMSRVDYQRVELRKKQVQKGSLFASLEKLFYTILITAFIPLLGGKDVQNLGYDKDLKSYL